MQRPSAQLFRLLVAVSLVLAWSPASAGDKFAWSPVSAEELALKEVPGYPGLKAVILDRDSFTDDAEGLTKETVRVKILTDQGRDYANIEIPYIKDWQRFSDLRARLIRADGTTVPFTGRIYDKLLARKGDFQILAKTFSFPEAQAGSIIEYHYEVTGGNLHEVEWLVGEDMFIRHLRLACRPRMGYAMTWFRLPQKPVEAPGGKMITLEMNNVAPFRKEEYSPPAKELKMRVDILYGHYKTVEEFWNEVAKNSADSIRQFIGENRGGVRKVVDQTVQPGDTPEQKLRKLYARAQQIRNLTWEPERDEKQIEKEHLNKRLDNVEDVLKNGYGRSWMVTRTFVAMARAAGFEADVIEISERDDHFFDRNLLSGWQFDGEIARVHVGNRDLVLDPGTPLCPIGLLRWFKMGVTGLAPSKSSATFLQIPVSRPEAARIHRQVNLELSPDGSGKGTIDLTYFGHEALELRLQYKDLDEVARKKAFEDRVKNRLPAGSTVKLETLAGWDKAEESLRARYSFESPQVGTHTGKRWIVPANLYEAGTTHPFESATRTHPVYFDYPSQSADEVVLTPPAGYTVESVPSVKHSSAPFGEYHVQVDKLEGNKLHTYRRFQLNEIFFLPETYPMLRNLYNEMRSGDGLQVVLRPAAN